MNHTPTWALLQKNVLLLLQLKRLGFELQNHNTLLELHLTPDCVDHFPASYPLSNQLLLRRDLAQLDKALTLRVRHTFRRLLTDCLVLTEPSGDKILRIGGHYGYFQHQGLMFNFLARLQLELDVKLPAFTEATANSYFATYDKIVAGLFSCNHLKN
jgi:hypothetical protein